MRSARRFPSNVWLYRLELPLQISSYPNFSWCWDSTDPKHRLKSLPTGDLISVGAVVKIKEKILKIKGIDLHYRVKVILFEIGYVNLIIYQEAFPRLRMDHFKKYTDKEQI